MKQEVSAREWWRTLGPRLRCAVGAFRNPAGSVEFWRERAERLGGQMDQISAAVADVDTLRGAGGGVATRVELIVADHTELERRIDAAIMELRARKDAADDPLVDLLGALLSGRKRVPNTAEGLLDDSG